MKAITVKNFFSFVNYFTIDTLVKTKIIDEQRAVDLFLLEILGPPLEQQLWFTIASENEKNKYLAERNYETKIMLRHTTLDESGVDKLMSNSVEVTAKYEEIFGKGYSIALAYNNGLNEIILNNQGEKAELCKAIKYFDYRLALSCARKPSKEYFDPSKHPVTLGVVNRWCIIDGLNSYMVESVTEGKGFTDNDLVLLQEKLEELLSWAKQSRRPQKELSRVKVLKENLLQLYEIYKQGHYKRGEFKKTYKAQIEFLWKLAKQK